MVAAFGLQPFGLRREPCARCSPGFVIVDEHAFWEILHREGFLLCYPMLSFCFLPLAGKFSLMHGCTHAILGMKVVMESKHFSLLSNENRNLVLKINPSLKL